METKHRKGDFLLLSASREIEFPNPVAVFAENPYVYTGTLGKVRNIQRTWKEISESNAWKRVVGTLSIPFEYSDPKQIAVPAEEPDHLLQQEDLVHGKTVNQIDVLMSTLKSPAKNADETCTIPESILKMYAGGFLSIAFINTDVGNMHRIGPGKFYPLRNFYASKHHLLLENESKLAKRLDNYWRNTYPERKGLYSRAIESGTTLSQVVWSRSSGEFNRRIFPGVSTVGLLVERSILSDKKGRDNAIQFIHEKYKQTHSHLKQNQNPLAELYGRAGGMKAEDYYDLAISLGVHAELIAHGNNPVDKRESFNAHVEGPPVALVRQLILTLATTSNCELHNIESVKNSGPRIYPSGMRDLLTI